MKIGTYYAFDSVASIAKRVLSPLLESFAKSFDISDVSGDGV